MSKMAEIRFKEGLYQVVSGKFCVGRTGYIDAEITEGTKLGNVMFYSIEGEYPYRICLKARDLKRVV